MEGYRPRAASQSEVLPLDRTDRAPLTDEKRDAFALEILELYSDNQFAQDSRYALGSSSFEDLKTYLDNMFYASGDKDDQEIAYLEVGFQFAVAKKYLTMRDALKKAA
jgi:hypothetical protein